MESTTSKNIFFQFILLIHFDIKLTTNGVELAYMYIFGTNFQMITI